MRTDDEAYLLDNAWDLARARFDGLEAASDAETFANLRHLGVAPGWRCLEPGPGSGSVAAWLARAVGPAGRVVAVDLDPRFVPRDVPNLDVVQADLRAFEVADGSFDLVHTRAFLVHLPQREEVVARLARALKPGGRALFEEPDWSTDAPAPDAPAPLADLYHRVMPRLMGLLADRGMASRFGLALPGVARRAGLTVQRTRGYNQVVQGGSEAARFEWLTFLQFRAMALAAGVASADDYRAFLDLFGDPAFSYVRPLICCVSATKP
jgi:SAM-dependent methyltransferase